MDRRLFIFGSALALVGASACKVNAQNNVAASIPLDLSGPRPTAQLVIGNAAPVTAIFDTGAAASVLRLSYARRIGAANEGPAAAHGPTGTPIEGFRTTIRSARLGGAQFDNALAVALDIPLPLEGVDAIISPGVFSGRFVRFDFAAGVAQILPITDENTPQGRAQAYVGEDTHGRITSTPGVQVALPGAAPLAAILDTGSRGGLALPFELSRSVTLSETLTPDEPMRLMGAERPAFKARINGRVQVGELTLESPEVRFIQGMPETIVGMRILRNSVVVIDPAGQRSWVLAPSAAVH